MTLELQVLTGSRAGATLTFDQREVTVGRHGSSDLRFDPQVELDVSSRHAELRELNGTWTLVDQASTNGTYVNGVRVTGSKTIHDGDVISFGVSGPRVEVKSGAGPRASSSVTPPGTVVGGARQSPGRMDTNVRVAMAVSEQTSAMKKMFGGALVVVLLLAASAFFWSQRQNNQREMEYQASLARSDSALAALQRTLTSRTGDTAVTAQLLAELDRKKGELAKARTLTQQGSPASPRIEELSKSLIGAAQMDVPKIREANDAAVAFIVSDLDGQPTGGTAFGVSASGMLVTNKHMVQTEKGTPARRLMVLYANTNKWKPAHLVRVSDTDDLALMQVDEPGVRPLVSGISRSSARASVGSPVVTIGYPLANDTPMQGEGMNITALTTTTLGTVSKRLDDVLQLDSFSAHGASGSPVFDAQGNVVGVIYGGARESGGRIVYAVPAQRLIAFLGNDGAGLLR